MENSVYYTQAKNWVKTPLVPCPQQLELGSHHLGLCSVEGLLPFISPGVSIYCYAISI